MFRPELPTYIMLLWLASSPSASSVCFKNRYFLEPFFFRLLLRLLVLFLNKPFSSEELPRSMVHLLSSVITYPYVLLHKCKDCLFLFYLTALFQLSSVLTKKLLDVDDDVLLLLVVMSMITIIIVIKTATALEVSDAYQPRRCKFCC